MAQSKEPATPDAAAAPEPELEQPPAAAPVPDGVVAKYTSGQERTYRFPGAPITARPGDIARLPYLPEDGHWRGAPGLLVTRLPDNHPANQPEGPDPDHVAHSLAEHSGILARLGLTKTQAQEDGEQP